jgi:hypothetical protein
MPCRLDSFWTSEYPTGDPSARARLNATAGGVGRNVAFVVPGIALSRFFEVSGEGASAGPSLSKLASAENRSGIRWVSTALYGTVLY